MARRSPYGVSFGSSNDFAPRSTARRNGIGVFDIHVEEGRHRVTLDGGADHDERVADPKLRRSLLMELAHRAKDVLDECHESLGIVDSDSRDHGGPTSGYVLRHSQLHAAERIGGSAAPSSADRQGWARPTPPERCDGTIRNDLTVSCKTFAGGTLVGTPRTRSNDNLQVRGID